MKAYFARPVTHYGQDFDKAVIDRLRRAGMTVVDPADPWYQAEYKLQGMKVFTDAAASCDIVFYRGFEDGAIGAGVLKEIAAAGAAGVPAVQIESVRRDWNYLSVEDTRERVKYGRI
jgi:hypothetical protein